MSKFNPGDRVIITDDSRGEVDRNPYLHVGSLGTVTTENMDWAENGLVSVEWDDNLIGFGHSCSGNAKQDHGWRVFNYTIALYQETPAIDESDFMEVLMYAD